MRRYRQQIDPSAAMFDTGGLSCVQRAMAAVSAGRDVCSTQHAYDVSSAVGDLAAADVAAEMGVARPAHVIARYVVDFEVAS